MRFGSFNMDVKAVGVIFLIIGVVKCTNELVSGYDATEAPTSTKKYTTFIDLMIDEISSQEWNENELQCHGQILNILMNVRNSTLWATWIWNSMQLPTGQFFRARNHIGNFDQCLRRLWRDDPVPTQYCLVDVQLAAADNRKQLTNVNAYDTAKSYLSIKTKYDFTFNTMLWGVCAPAVCAKHSVERFVSALFKLSHMGPINEHPKIDVQDCQQTHIPPANTTGLYILLITVVFLVIVACVCTYISNQKSPKLHSLLMKIINSFDLRSNASSLLAASENDIKVMHGMRALTSCIVIFLHAMFAHLMSSPANGLDLDKDFEFYSKFLSHTSIFVDTFFMMSGLLLMKNFKPETGRVIHPFRVIIKRYFRFIWVFIVMIIIIITTTPYLAGGPMWARNGKIEKEACEKSWWLSLLMLSNYVDNRNMCIQASWYIPADYHMTLASIFLYWVYQRYPRGGLYLFGLVATASAILPGIYTYQNEVEAMIPFRFECLSDTRKNIVDVPTYVWSHFRATPYFVGLAAGYILSIYKPANYRNLISKTHTLVSFVIILVLLTSILLLGPVFLSREYNALESALFVVINRPLWAALCASLIFICEYGSLPIVPEFLSWSAFVPLSKLSYGMYLCHYIFLLRIVVPIRSQSWHDQLKVLQDSLGLVAVAVLVSFFVALFLEFPLNNIMNILIDRKSQPQKQVNDTATNTAAKMKSVCANNHTEECLYKNCCANEIEDCGGTHGVRSGSEHLSEDMIKKDM